MSADVVASTADAVSTVRLLARLRGRGVEVWADDDRLRYRAPAGALDDDLCAELVQHKQAVLAFLAAAAAAADEQVPPLRHIPANGPARLSFAQQRFWFLDQATPRNPTFNLPYAIGLTGRLDRDALRRALNAVVARHAALRATFPSTDGEPVQVFAPDLVVDLPLVDLTTEPDLDGARRARIDTEFRRGFDLACGPLVRATLLRCAPDEHVLLLTLHHIVFDGWSYSVLVDELAACYSADRDGTAPELPALPVDYADYARWQRDWMEGRRFSQQLAYWRVQLAGTPLTLELPTDRPRPAVQTFEGAVVRVQLPAELGCRLTELARGEGATLFMVLLAAFQVVLSRYSGQTDLVVGTPVAGRTHPDLERLIGFFVNMLVLRGDLSGRLTFRQFLHRVRETTLGAYAHQHLPFERLVEDLQPERDLSRTPIFQVMFALQNLPRAAVQMPGVTLRTLFGPSGVAKYDVSLVLVENDGALSGAVEYNTDLFDHATIERMAGHLGTLLRAVVADPDQPVDLLPLMGRAEHRQVVEEWNATAADVPSEQLLHDLVAAAATESPDAVAAVYEDETLTYSELDRRANQLARHLQSLGVGPETLVGLSTERGTGMLVGLLGILKAGGAYLPLDPHLPAERLEFMLADADAPVLLSQASLRGQLSGYSGRVLCLDTDWPSVAVHPPTAPVTAVAATNLAYVIYTSGSTGQPKGVQIPHRAVVNYVTAMRREPGMRRTDTVLAVTTLSFDLSVLEVFLPLTVGAHLVIASRELTRDGGALVRRLTEIGGTCMVATPATWRMLLDAGWRGDGRLKVFCDGEALPASLADALVARAGEVWNLYGPTETTVFSTAERITGGPVTVGRPIANTEIYLLDARSQPVPVGVPAEICIGGDGVARGYRNRPDLTAERFVADPFSRRPGARLYRTGDLGRYRPDGRIEYLGRLDTQVKLRGYRIETGEIQAVLEHHPGVRQSVVVVRPDRAGDPRLVAYVVPSDDGAAPDAAAMRVHLSRKLPDYMVPAAFVRVDALPRSHHGKIDARALPAPELDSTDRGPSVSPATATEKRIAEVWSRVLGVETIGVDDNFFDLGGESMKAVRAARCIEPDLPVLDLFAHPTVRGLADHLDRRVAPVEQCARLLHQLTSRSAQQAETTLVCVPFGGGDAISYQELARAVPDTWALYALELPGHDYARRDEPLLPATRQRAGVRRRSSPGYPVRSCCTGTASAPRSRSPSRNGSNRWDAA